jgi:hypothetical protein
VWCTVTSTLHNPASIHEGPRPDRSTISKKQPPPQSNRRTPTPPNVRARSLPRKPLPTSCVYCYGRDHTPYPLRSKREGLLGVYVTTCDPGLWSTPKPHSVRCTHARSRRHPPGRCVAITRAPAGPRPTDHARQIIVLSQRQNLLAAGSKTNNTSISVVVPPPGHSPAYVCKRPLVLVYQPCTSRQTVDRTSGDAMAAHGSAWHGGRPQPQALR